VVLELQNQKLVKYRFIPLVNAYLMEISRQSDKNIYSINFCLHNPDYVIIKVKSDLAHKVTVMLDDLKIFKKKLAANIDEITAQRLVDDITAPMYEHPETFNTLIEVGAKRDSNDELPIKFTGFDESAIQEKQNVIQRKINILLKSRNMIFEKVIAINRSTMPLNLIEKLFEKCMRYDDE